MDIGMKILKQYLPFVKAKAKILSNNHFTRGKVVLLNVKYVNFIDYHLHLKIKEYEITNLPYSYPLCNSRTPRSWFRQFFFHSLTLVKKKIDETTRVEYASYTTGTHAVTVKYIIFENYLVFAVRCDVH